MKPVFLTAVFLLCSAFLPAQGYAQAQLDASILATSEIPLQGSCGSQGLNADALGSSVGSSTMACAGSASDMINLNFSDGSFDKCVYIDNADPGNHAYFVPVKTIHEWLAFKVSTQAGGNLYNKLNVAYGCETAAMVDTCGKPQTLPRARNGEVIPITSLGSKIIYYTCVASTTCGTWIESSATGSCATDGLCGSANGVASEAQPSSNLCSAGTATTVTQGSTWNWQCVGLLGGVTTACSAPITRDGVCGVAAGGTYSSTPTTGLCSQGTMQSMTQNMNSYDWVCGGENGGAPVGCSANRVQTAVCGTANGNSYSNPPSSGLCGQGTVASAVTENPTSYNWTCSATGYSPTSCAATRTIADCPAQTVAWASRCSGTVGALANGNSASISDSNGLKAGSITVTCNNGTLTQSDVVCNFMGTLALADAACFLTTTTPNAGTCASHGWTQGGQCDMVGYYCLYQMVTSQYCGGGGPYHPVPFYAICK